MLIKKLVMMSGIGINSASLYLKDSLYRLHNFFGVV